MRKDKLYILGSLVLLTWIFITYFLYFHRPKTLESLSHYATGAASAAKGRSPAVEDLRRHVEAFGARLKEQERQNQDILAELRELRGSGDALPDQGLNNAKKTGKKEEFQDFNDYVPEKEGELSMVAGGGGAGGGAGLAGGGVAEQDRIAVLMFACNRPTVSKALDSLLKHRPDERRFPIIVSQVRLKLLINTGGKK